MFRRWFLLLMLCAAALPGVMMPTCAAAIVQSGDVAQSCNQSSSVSVNGQQHHKQALAHEHICVGCAVSVLLPAPLTNEQTVSRIHGRFALASLTGIALLPALPPPRS